MKVYTQVRIEEMLYERLKKIAEAEKRSINAQIEYFVQKCVEQYEDEHKE